MLSPGDVGDVEEGADGKVVATRCENIRENWSFFAVVFCHLVGQSIVIVKMSKQSDENIFFGVVQMTWKAGLAKVESVWRSVIASWLSSRLPSHVLGQNKSLVEFLNLPKMDQIEEGSPAQVETCEKSFC